MAIKRFIYISGPRMGTNNQKSTGAILGKKRKKNGRKKRS